MAIAEDVGRHNVVDKVIGGQLLMERLPLAEQLEVARLWNAPVALAVESEVEVEVRNRGQVSIRVEAVDDVAVALRREPAGLAMTAPAGGEGRAAYTLQPAERGDARLGSVHLRYQSGLRLAERWARADLAQTVRVYPDLDEAKRHTIYLLRSRQIELEKRLTRRDVSSKACASTLPATRSAMCAGRRPPGAAS